ncbi:peptidoglycan-binding protein LysM [Algoriphagus zhangzhouensis]|uniref:Potassium binding protein Kbp n=1 Tax=Algoriphagus zhangzhouensis TaxID=1073327 RepID=A0A1M7ZIZ9_9BACT|nr:peptidoglycan-binding protein LysM [Algoriphagus zhangzhouensis]TDY43642.1 nucleoid-associated protein YgaU [Algoriphagus zhangzhouensis]SHO64885.1 Nucleoid-associated protein YgaU, contains BON and LysM domains [Algoriphagus zhangzhouensis]
MGLISFIKDAGAKIFGGKTTAEKAADAAKAAAEAKLKREEAAAKVLEQTISDLDLQVVGLNIQIDDDKATVSGAAFDQATKEKVVLVVGNSQGIATVDDQMTVENPEPEATYHTVVSGDTLSKIAKTVYGDAMKYPVIFEANKPMLKSPDLIYPGQVLRIPPLG